MIDPILTARLEVLKQNLSRVDHSQPQLKSMELKHFEVSEGLWEGLDATIGKQARKQLIDLDKIQATLREAEQKGKASAKDDLREAWRCYAEVYEQSQEIFGEYLEFIGGLTFRDKGLDERICLIADELVRKCAKESTGIPWQSLTVLAPHEAVTKTLARIIRLRFQEWTIWTLPFTAHEFGHVVIRESEVKDFVEKEVETELQRLPQDEATEQAKRLAKRLAESHLDEFLADAFATYTMGPAYACAAILLRFNPSVAYTDDNEHPSDAKRAHVVFSMLKLMDNDAGKLLPYKYVIERLEKEWEDALDRAGPSGALKAEDRKCLKGLVKYIWNSFYLCLLPPARYPHTGEEGWNVAEKWCDTWSEQLKSGQDLSISVSHIHKLRDVLNAAWLYRIYNPDNVKEIKEIAEAAYDLCEKIIDAIKKEQLKRSKSSYMKRQPSKDKGGAS